MRRAAGGPGRRPPGPRAQCPRARGRPDTARSGSGEPPVDYVTTAARCPAAQPPPAGAARGHLLGNFIAPSLPLHGDQAVDANAESRLVNCSRFLSIITFHSARSRFFTLEMRNCVLD